MKNITAEIDYPLLKECKKVVLTDEDKEDLNKIIANIININSSDNAPLKIDNKKCAYFDLCYI